jgi:hypothetical protein
MRRIRRTHKLIAAKYAAIIVGIHRNARFAPAGWAR